MLYEAWSKVFDILFYILINYSNFKPLRICGVNLGSQIFFFFVCFPVYFIHYPSHLSSCVFSSIKIIFVGKNWIFIFNK